MNKPIKTLALLICLPAIAISCDKGDDTQNDTEWINSNQFFLDSLANAYQSQQDDPGTIIEDDTIYMITAQYMTSTNIYYKKIGVKDGFVGAGELAKFTDVARVYYRGYLIDGTLFDYNFSGEYPDYELDIPSDFTISGLQASTSGVIYGWTEILQHMRAAENLVDKKGDFFRVYIPYTQGYGTSGSGSIPGYSTLIFDINLLEINPDS